MAISFKEKYFNPLYFILNDILKNDKIRIVLVYGGKRSAKTVSISQLLCKESVCKGKSTIALRKESTTIETTLQKSFDLAVNSMYLYPAFRRLERAYKCNNGSEIILKGIDDKEKAKGVEGYTYIYLDELNTFERDEFTTYNISLSGLPGQKIFASWNPVDEKSWVKVNLVDSYKWIDTEYKLPSESSFVKISTDGTAILIKTTYPDNYWINGSPDGSYGYRDEAIIYEYNKLKDVDYNQYRVNVLGEWGKIRVGSEYYATFKPEKHIKKCKYDNEIAIHLSFDQNVNPYLSAIVSQIEKINDIYYVRIIKEYAFKHPHNKTEILARKILEDLSSYKGQLYLYGDSSGNKEDTRNIYSDYDIIKRVMFKHVHNNSDRVLRKNPLHSIRRPFMSALFTEQLPIRIQIDPLCKYLIQDLESVKEDSDGTKLKEKAKDKQTGITSEKYGHHSDCFDYLIVMAFKSYFDNYSNYLKI
jgi:PBSX family phage terminase large subunit